jgi:hypothetical protein
MLCELIIRGFRMLGVRVWMLVFSHGKSWIVIWRQRIDFIEAKSKGRWNEERGRNDWKSG